MTGQESLIPALSSKIARAVEGIEAFEAGPDGYCACDPGKPCYLHGVTIPEAVAAAEQIAQELRRKAFPPQQVEA